MQILYNLNGWSNLIQFKTWISQPSYTNLDNRFYGYQTNNWMKSHARKFCMQLYHKYQKHPDEEYATTDKL